MSTLKRKEQPDIQFSWVKKNRANAFLRYPDIRFPCVKKNRGREAPILEAILGMVSWFWSSE